MNQPAIFTDDLPLSLEMALSLIEQGARDRRSAAHTPIVASIDEAGVPQQRVMILRELDYLTRRLRFHTDARSDKVSQLSGNGAMSILFYDAAAKIQVRVIGQGWTETDTDAAQNAWENATHFARRCYLAQQAPGSVSAIPASGLNAEIEGKKPDDSELAPARPNFAILLFEFSTIEWLYLANTGHRRARWHWDGDAWQGQWLIP